MEKLGNSTDWKIVFFATYSLDPLAHSSLTTTFGANFLSEVCEFKGNPKILHSKIMKKLKFVTSKYVREGISGHWTLISYLDMALGHLENQGAIGFILGPVFSEVLQSHLVKS